MLQILQAWLPLIETVAITFTAIVVIFLRSKSGAAQISNEIISTYKLRVEQLEANEKSASLRMHEHTKEIGQLQGALAEKDKEVSRLRAILENRDPELTNVLKDIRAFMVQIDKHMQEQAI